MCMQQLEDNGLPLVSVACSNRAESCRERTAILRLILLLSMRDFADFSQSVVVTCVSLAVFEPRESSHWLPRVTKCSDSLFHGVHNCTFLSCCAMIG